MESMQKFRLAFPVLLSQYCQHCRHVGAGVGGDFCRVSSWSYWRKPHTAYGIRVGMLQVCHVPQQLPRRVASTFTGMGVASLQQKIVEPLGALSVDRHNGIHVNLEKWSWVSPDEFNVQLEVSLGRWIREKRCAAWLRVPIDKSAIIAEAAKFGFQFHHAEGTTAMLYLWLKSGPCKIHPFASHQVGVAGCIVHPVTSNVLVVRDKKQQHSSWKFPGGLSELGESIADTAKREVLEETGLQTDFKGVLAFRQQHQLPGAFGRSDLYFVCHLLPLTFEIQPCSDEISACQWISINKLVNDSSTTALTRHVAQLVRQGIPDGFSSVAITSTERKSIYRGQRFQVFSRPLNSSNLNLFEQSYLHDVVDWQTK